MRTRRRCIPGHNCCRGKTSMTGSSPLNILQAIKQSHQVQFEFLVVDLDLAMTLLNFVRITHSTETARRNKEHSHVAYDAVTRHLEHLHPTNAERDYPDCAEKRFSFKSSGTVPSFKKALNLIMATQTAWRASDCRPAARWIRCSVSSLGISAETRQKSRFAFSCSFCTRIRSSRRMSSSS